MVLLVSTPEDTRLNHPETVAYSVPPDSFPSSISASSSSSTDTSRPVPKHASSLLNTAPSLSGLRGLWNFQNNCFANSYLQLAAFFGISNLPCDPHLRSLLAYVESNPQSRVLTMANQKDDKKHMTTSLASVVKALGYPVGSHEDVCDFMRALYDSVFFPRIQPRHSVFTEQGKSPVAYYVPPQIQHLLRYELRFGEHVVRKQNETVDCYVNIDAFLFRPWDTNSKCLCAC